MNYLVVLALGLQLLSVIHNGASVDIKETGGPVGKVTINKIEACTVKSPIKSKLKIKFNRADGDKAGNADITLPFNVDNNIKYQATLKKWENNQWVKMDQKFEGSLCPFIESNGREIWDKFAKTVSPKVGACSTVKKGSYTVKDWSVENKDVKVNYIFYGKFKVDVLIKKGKDAAFCYIADVESSPPK